MLCAHVKYTYHKATPQLEAALFITKFSHYYHGLSFMNEFIETGNYCGVNVAAPLTAVLTREVHS